jgi:hypothetical protein
MLYEVITQEKFSMVFVLLQARTHEGEAIHVRTYKSSQELRYDFSEGLGPNILVSCVPLGNMMQQSVSRKKGHCAFGIEVYSSLRTRRRDSAFRDGIRL